MAEKINKQKMCLQEYHLPVQVHSTAGKMEYHRSAVCYVTAGSYVITSKVMHFIPWGVWYFFRCVKEWFVAP